MGCENKETYHLREASLDQCSFKFSCGISGNCFSECIYTLFEYHAIIFFVLCLQIKVNL